MKLLNATLLGILLCLPGFAGADDGRHDRRAKAGHAYDGHGRHDQRGYGHKHRQAKSRHRAPPRHYAGKRHGKKAYEYPRRYYRPAYRPVYRPVYRYGYRPALTGFATFSYVDPYTGAITISVPID